MAKETVELVECLGCDEEFLTSELDNGYCVDCIVLHAINHSPHNFVEESNE